MNLNNPDPVDETDGTPEWAKRMFERLRYFKYLAALFLAFVVLPIWSGYELLRALFSGGVEAGKPIHLITFAEHPDEFVRAVLMYCFGLLSWAVLIVFRKRRIAVFRAAASIDKHT